MKKVYCLFFALLVSALVIAQIENEYERSSIATLMIFHGEDEFCKDIAYVFDTLPTPDKFNNHNIVGKRFVDFGAFYKLKKKNETYAFRSQNESEIKQNQNLLDYMKNRNIILQSPSFNLILLQAYCKELNINYEGVSSWTKVNEKLNPLTETRKQQIANRVGKKCPQGLNKAKYGKTLTGKEIKTNAEAIECILNENNYGRDLVAQWFNLRGDSIENATFNMALVSDRANYNATQRDVAIARKSIRGLDMIRDHGTELIKNTYVIVNDITYVTTEEKAQAAKVASSVVLSVLGALASVATGTNMSKSTSQTIDAVNAIADSFTGFNVKTHSYLYRLVWNEEVENTFYSLYYCDEPNPEKIRSFLNNDTLFRVEYVAHAYEYDEKSTTKDKVDRNEYVKYICTRSLDKNIAELQYLYEDFRVKVPVQTLVKNNGLKIYTAKVGMKEGITTKSRFKVVKKVYDQQTHTFKYQYVATLKPLKVWDNRYYMTGEAPQQDIDATQFAKVAGGEILPGMLIVQERNK